MAGARIEHSIAEGMNYILALLIRKDEERKHI